MIQETQKSGAFELFDKDMDVKYLTKDVNDGMIETTWIVLRKHHAFC